MSRPKQQPESNPLNRRDFLKGGSLASLMMMMGAVELKAQDAAENQSSKPVGPDVRIGVIGCGIWGREILNALAQLPNAPVAAVCDHYAAYLRRGQRAAPKAEAYEDYRQLLANPDVQAVIVATPTHQHREIVEAALAVGKHVYCEAPLAESMEHARAIALAAKKHFRSVFQSGLQLRSDPQRHFLLPFIRSGAPGGPVMARSQWHKKESWRRTSPTPEREHELNWRLRQESSLGLIGEMGVHQVDQMSWFFGRRPEAVTGFGSLIKWNDGRDVPDTIQSVIEFGQGVRMIYDATLANSFDGEYDIYYGSDAAIMLRGDRAWMFKEADAPLLGWEVYARKDAFYHETGIALVANATKLSAQGDNAAEASPSSNTSLLHALEAFVANCGIVTTAIGDFTSTYGEDEAGLRQYLAGDATTNALPYAGFTEGFEATVAVIQANEAINKGTKVKMLPEWFELS